MPSGLRAVPEQFQGSLSENAIKIPTGFIQEFHINPEQFASNSRAVCEQGIKRYLVRWNSNRNYKAAPINKHCKKKIQVITINKNTE